jgi:hypothetical protein
MNNIASDMNHDLVVQETRYADNRITVTVREKFDDRTADMLLLLTRAGDDDDFPEYYLNMAGKPKGMSERVVLQQEVGAAAEVVDLVPLVTPSQVIALNNVYFCGSAYNEIGTGVLPFSITPADATTAKGRRAIIADRARAEMFDLSGESVNGAVSATDARSMRNLKGYVAADWMEAQLQIWSVATMMAALIGTTHPTIALHNQCLRKYDHMEPWVFREFDTVYGVRPGPALVVFHVQLLRRSWLQEQKASHTFVSMQDFFAGLQCLSKTIFPGYHWSPTCRHSDPSCMSRAPAPAQVEIQAHNPRWPPPWQPRQEREARQL